jgi:hypothetical protein
MTMHRKLTALALAAALAAAAGTAAAQDVTFSWNPRSGDVWMDTWLGDMNNYGYRYREPFIDEMVRYHGAPRDLVSDLLINRRWAPGDVYMACSIASIIGRPCRYVVEQYDRDRGQGWGVIAKRMGIKPGSAEFHRLKQGFVPTYDRWARPIRLDAQLERDFPNHGKGKGGGKPAHAGGGKSEHGGGHADHGPTMQGKGKSGEHGNGGQHGGGAGKAKGGKGKGKG